MFRIRTTRAHKNSSNTVSLSVLLIKYDLKRRCTKKLSAAITGRIYREK